MSGIEMVILGAAVSAAIKIVIQELFTIQKKKVLQVWKVDDKLIDLHDTYKKIATKLGNLDCLRCQIDNTGLEASWLHDLIMYCYETEDLIDDLILSRPIKEENEDPDQLSLRKKIFKYGRLKIPGKISKLLERLKCMETQIESLLPTEAINSQQLHQGGQESPVPSYQGILSDNRPFVSGTIRDRDKHTIITQLQSEQHHLGVSIIGMDGIGKTALARHIGRTIQVDDKNGFLILSALVSDDFKMGAVVKKLFEDHQHQTIESRQSFHTLEDLLRNNKCLIILDDLWDVEREEWDKFKSNYLSSSPCWRMLTTTRNPKVAEVTQSIAHYLDIMTDEDCKQLIMEKANMSASNRIIWDSDVKVIAEKCMGMPIFAYKFGLQLNTESSSDGELEKTIEELKGITLWEQLQFPYLKLNEPTLPPHLKRCLAYCSLFTPDHIFNRDDLVQLWEAEGLVRTKGRGSAQQTGSQCFDYMLSRSFFQPSDSRNKRQPSYKMHKINHTIAQLHASKEFLRIETSTANLHSCKYIHHLLLSCENADVPLLEQIEKCEGLRTFLLPRQNVPKKRNISSTFFLKLERLRLLDLSHTKVSDLLEPSTLKHLLQKCNPKQMFKNNKPFKHLRFLDLSGSDIQKLPEHLNPFRALQVLKLEDCKGLNELPNDLNKLISLTHLQVNMRSFLHVTPNLGKLTNLEILSSYRVEKNPGNMVAELKDMKHLREICIYRLNNISNGEEAEESMLSTKMSLKRLVLEWDDQPGQMPNVREVLEGLEPASYLKDLTVRNYKGQQFPEWISSSSKKLESIHLQNCQDCKVLPSLGQLPLLKTLVLVSIDNLEIVDRRFCGQDEWQFRSLESLEFHNMERLLYWIGLDEGDMPCLHALKIINCPKLAKLPSLEHQGSLVNLEIIKCPKLKSLPELSSSLNGESGKLTIMGCRKVQKRCRVGGADWEKIKDITCKYIDEDDVNTAGDEPSSPQVCPTITKQTDAVDNNKVPPAPPFTGYK